MDPRARIGRYLDSLRDEPVLAAWQPMISSAEASLDAGLMTAADVVELLDGLAELWARSGKPIWSSSDKPEPAEVAANG